jgi:hypothetical protein
MGWTNREPFWCGKQILSEKEIHLNLPFDERGGRGKFGRADSYRVRMHKGIGKPTNFLLYILNLLGQQIDNLLCPMAKISCLYLLSFSSYWKNSHTHGLFRWVTHCSAPIIGLSSIPEINILDRKVALDLPLDERVCHAKFGCTGSYLVQMHKE